MGNPFADFTAQERRNIIIYMIGIMLYKFGLEAFTGSITLLATDRFKKANTYESLAILQGLNQAFQCVGSIAIAPLIKRFPTRSVLAFAIALFGILSAIIIIIDVSTGGKIPLENGTSRPGLWNPIILFPVYSVIGICHGMVELIRRVIPRDIVGGDVVKLKRMDATVHVFYEIAGTSGAFFATFLVLKLGSAIAPAMTPFLFLIAAGAWSFIGLLDSDNENRRQLEGLESSLLTQIIHGFAHFGTSMYRGAQIVFSSRKFIWLIPGYSIPLFTHRYLESQLSPAFAKSVLNERAYSQIMVGGSNFGELLGALFVLFFARKIKTPLPWLRVDAIALLIIWILPYSYPAKENALSYAWTLAAIWVPVSFGWAAGDVSLAAYIQSALVKIERPDDKVSPLGAVMAFLYVLYIVIYAVLSFVLAKTLDFHANAGDIRPAFIYVGGVMYTVVCVVLLLATFIPKGSFALNPDIIDGVDLEDEEEYTIDEKGAKAEVKA